MNQWACNCVLSRVRQPGCGGIVDVTQIRSGLSRRIALVLAVGGGRGLKNYREQRDWRRGTGSTGGRSRWSLPGRESASLFSANVFGRVSSLLEKSRGTGREPVG